jgi:hypothetical protein
VCNSHDCYQFLTFQPGGVGRGLGVGRVLGVGVGLGVTLGVAVGVEVGVTVGVGVVLGVAVAVAVGLGVGVPLGQWLKAMCALSAPFWAPGVAGFTVPMFPFIAGQASIDPKVPPIGVGSPRRAAISRLPSVKPSTRRSLVPLLSRLAQNTTFPAASIVCIGLRENARPRHCPPSIASKNTTTFRQFPGAPANQPELVV